MANLLEPLGIDAMAESVYRAMLAHPGEKAADLAVRLGLTDIQVTSAQATLSRLALVRQSCESPGDQRPLTAETGMELLLARQEAMLQDHAHRLSLSRAAAAQLIAEAAGPGPHPADVGVEVLIGMDQIRDRLAELGRDVKEELLTFAPEGAGTIDGMRAYGPLDTALLERGVRLRTMYLTSIRSSRPALTRAQWLVDSGGQVRTVATLPTRMIILDRRIAVLPTDVQDSRDSAVVVSGSAIVVALCALFDSVWAEGQTLEARTAPPRQRGLSSQEIATLRLMATGLTLGGIAKRLGVSPRTARRITAALLEHLDAGSRFEAGVKAVQQGWLPVDG